MPVIERTEAAVELRECVFLAGRAEALIRRLVQRKGKDLLLPRRAHVTHGSERRTAEQHPGAPGAQPVQWTPPP